jgi:large subunit ribosomal protein L25
MSGSLRTNVGKKDAKAGRKAGMVPCVLYGGKEQVHFFVPAKGFKDVIFTPEICFIQLEIGGKDYQAVLQDVQYHPVTDEILHIDLLELAEDRPIIMGVPIKVSGVAPGVLRGGKLIQKMRKLKVKSLPAHMPGDITVDIGGLDINDSVKVSDLHRDNLTFLDSSRAMVVAVQVTRVVEEPKPEETAAAAAPEGAAKEEKKEGAEK